MLDVHDGHVVGIAHVPVEAVRREDDFQLVTRRWVGEEELGSGKKWKTGEWEEEKNLELLMKMFA